MWSFGYPGASVQGSYVLPCCPEPQFFRFEGVWLTETGMAVLRNLTMSPLHKRRQRRGRLGLPGEAGLEGSEPSDALGPDDKKDGDLDTDELLKGEGWAGESQRKAESGRTQPIRAGMLGRGYRATIGLPLALRLAQVALWQITGFPLAV